ncbi:MAG: hypothetical protein COB08_015165 [Rhodobacteraceae bacterium]|nr:hypothetical protein [Paracoccaceae bacterium]
MAIDKEIPIKVSMDPFQEVDKKKWKQMEADVKGFKKPGRVDISGKFSVTSAKWDKRKLEAQARAIFRYDLSLFASQIWQAFDPISKAKNDRDKQKAEKAFLAFIPKQIKVLERNLKEKFEDFREDIASGAGDDLAELKRARKALDKETAFEIGQFAEDFREVFVTAIVDDLRPLKTAETKASGEEKAKATEALEKELKKATAKLDQELAIMSKGFAKYTSALGAIPAALSKSLKKDVSDPLKAEYTKAAGELTKALKPIEKHAASAVKNAEAAMKKVAHKDFSKSTLDLGAAALLKTIGASGDLADSIGKIDAKLKKLEQAVKKR